jgi:hypothetical protein
MSGAIPLLPNTPSWRGAQLKHRDRTCYQVFCVCQVLEKKFEPNGLVYQLFVDFKKAIKLRGPFEKFVDSPYYSESELCGGGGDGLFFQVPSLANDALLTTLHPLLENVPQTVGHFKISCLEAPISWLEKFRNRMGRDLDCIADVLMGFHRSTFSKPNTEFNSVLAPCQERKDWN